jgi:lipopolysaccharide transport system permease protein
LFLCMMAYFGLQGHPLHPNLYVLLFPFIILLMAILGLGLGMKFEAGLVDSSLTQSAE